MLFAWKRFISSYGAYLPRKCRPVDKLQLTESYKYMYVSVRFTMVSSSSTTNLWTLQVYKVQLQLQSVSASCGFISTWFLHTSSCRTPFPIRPTNTSFCSVTQYIHIYMHNIQHLCRRCDDRMRLKWLTLLKLDIHKNNNKLFKWFWMANWRHRP